MIKFPEGLDTDAELHKVVDGVDDVVAKHHNDLVAAVKAIEEKLGIDGSAIVESFDYIIKQLAVKSEPPEGTHKITNIYRMPDGKIANVFEDTPAGGE